MEALGKKYVLAGHNPAAICSGLLRPSWMMPPSLVSTQ
jgi:hypothetical protein